MNETHIKAVAAHELAARFHRTAAEHNEKGDGDAGSWHAQRAIEHANRAYDLAKEAHNKSGRIEDLR
jgi:hypothetical protein